MSVWPGEGIRQRCDFCGKVRICHGNTIGYDLCTPCAEAIEKPAPSS